MNIKQNDYELVSIAKQGNEEVLEIIINKYQPVIKYIARRKEEMANKLGLDISDLYQEGMIGLVEAIEDFEEDKNATFYTFANLCITRKINTALTRNNRKRDKALNSSLSLDKKLADTEKTLLDIVEPVNAITPLSEIIEDETAHELYTKIKEQLSKREKKIFDLKIKGFTYQEIEKIMELNTKQIYSAMRRIKEKIRKEIDG